MAYRSTDTYRNSGTYPGVSFIPPTPSKVDTFRVGVPSVEFSRPGSVSVSHLVPDVVKVERFEYL
jgi:hypothetical protein